jgi:glycerophosphoryl diester phosphodiesterase
MSEETRRTRIVAHRGAEFVAPENTMAAFQAARSLGADAIEFDVHETRDHALVVHHDYMLDRTTSGSGSIWDRDLGYVRSLDAGGWFSSKFAGERVPLLHEVLEMPDLEFELELKALTRAYMEEVARAVEDHSAMHRTEFTSWNNPMLLALKAAYPHARIAGFTRPREQWMPEDVFERAVIAATEFAEVDSIHVHAADITPTIVESLHERGVQAHANDAATDEEVTRALALGADSISTADVATAVELRRVWYDSSKMRT